MFTYDSREWFTVFRFHKADTFQRILPAIFAISLYTAVVAFLELQWFHVPEKSYVCNIPIMHTLLGFVISILLVFRTNTAYDRW